MQWDLGSNSAYTKNQLVFWSDGKSNHLETSAIGSNSIIKKNNNKKNNACNYANRLLMLYLQSTFKKKIKKKKSMYREM